MSTSQSAPNSQSIPDQSSQPSSQSDLQSTPAAPVSSSDPDIIVINDNKEDKKLKKGKSEAWLHFDKVIIDGVVKAVCKYCNSKLRGDSGAGTSHLNNHYKTKHQNKGQGSIRQKLLASNFNKEHPELATYNFSHDGAKQELAKMIIMHEYPLSMVEHIGFKRYSSFLQPLFKVPCRNTIKSEILQIYEFERVKTSSLLESIKSRVAITTDMWTASNQKKGYMAITAHFIDASWTLQSRIIRFIYVPCPHTKEVLCDHLLECLMDWNLDRKLSCLTVDNCSTNDAMIDIILEKLDNSSLIAGGSLFHMRCAAHILNLIVKDGLDVMRVGLEKIRDSVAYWTATPKREEKFEETARQLRKRVDSIKSELDHYLDEDVVQKSEGFDLLNWWKVNELKYPNLQRLARDFLAVPASTVASESAFSSSGRLVSPHRNRLHPKTLEALMCAQSWLWAAEMEGEASIGYATIYNDQESEDSCVTRQV